MTDVIDTLSNPLAPVSMKALSLWQPWASMVARGIKTIETRSWSTKYRGPLAIHATAPATKADHSDPVWDALRAAGHIDGIVLLDSLAPLAFGALVATCLLVDVVPIGRCHDPYAPEVPNLAVGVNWDGSRAWHIVGDTAADVTDQLPWGDFRPGRFAWMLSDIVRIDPPIPARGRQRLWTWNS